MLSTKTLIQHSKPLAAAKLFSQPWLGIRLNRTIFSATASSFNSITWVGSRAQSPVLCMSTMSNLHHQHESRGLSTAVHIKGIVSDGVSSDLETPKDKTGYVTRKLRVLDMDVVEKIKEELKSVDVNSDGRIDSDELSKLLRMHDKAFSEEEITAMRELFYAGKSGGSVSMERFIEALDMVVANKGNLTKLDNPLGMGTCGNEFLFFKPQGYNQEDIKDIELTHTKPQNFRDRLALGAVKCVRYFFDTATGWNYGKITPDMILNRTIYLETIAAVPGMCAAIVRHFRSLRQFKRDGGLMQMFLDEANNERMHLLTFVRMKNPGTFFRAAVIAGQFGFGAAFMLSYIISPKFCHRFVGYVEEEACTTYTKIIQAIEDAPADSELGKWRTEPAPKIARSYWKLGEKGTILETMYAVRADEAEHRDVNHLCSEIEDGMPNPVSNTEEKLNMMLLKYIQDMMEKNPDTPLAINGKTLA